MSDSTRFVSESGEDCDERLWKFVLRACPDAFERRRFERHLAPCSVCPRYVDQLRATIRVLGTLGEDDVPEPARDALLEAFRAWKRSA